MLVVISPTHAGRAEQTNYQHDALGRLVGSTTKCGTGGEIAVQIDYDAASNRSRYRVAGSGTMLINRQNTMPTLLGSGSWRLRKTGGTDGAFDASAESNSPVSVSAKINARSLSGVPNGFIALNANPFENHQGSLIAHATFPGAISAPRIQDVNRNGCWPKRRLKDWSRYPAPDPPYAG